jgi:hypothetical protein
MGKIQNKFKPNISFFGGQSLCKSILGNVNYLAIERMMGKQNKSRKQKTFSNTMS